MDTLVASVVTPIVYSKTIHVFRSFVCAQLQYDDYRKWRVRHDNCELLPMIRRRLQKKPRMQPVLHDSVVKSYVFDLLELATKPFLLLPRNSLLLVSKQMDFEQQNVKHRTQICGNNCFVRFKVPG